MAYNTTHVDLNRGTTGLSLTPEQVNEVLQNAVQESAIMRLAPQIQLPGSGVKMPVILGDPEATWIGETEEKHVGTPTVTEVTMTPYLLSVILPFSNQFKRDYAKLYDEIVKRLPAALGKKFDQTVFFAQAAPGTGFSILSSSPTAEIYGGEWAGLVAAKKSIANAGGDLNGWALSPQGEAALLGAVDGNLRPLFVNGIDGASFGSILAAPAVKAKSAYDATSKVVAVAGDWSMARWGVVDGIQLAISEEATINDGSKQINLFQRNMFAVRAEVEIGFVCADDDFFTLIGGTNPNA